MEKETPLLPASALALRLTWAEPFRELPCRHAQGPWQGRTPRGLYRTSSTPDLVRVASGGTTDTVTTLEVAGADEVDVHLVLGEPHAAPGDVRPSRSAPSTICWSARR
ncbi:hypothetical protein [Streptomyces sp. NPDC059389]|uniref:hypothetical protein n=1 Tax=Streptomyces sp. NPDC059389 TaxID=3346818 RepID=UPI0036B6273A